MNILIYGTLFLISFLGLLHSMHVGDKYDMPSNNTLGKKISKWYFRISYSGCASFGLLFFGTIISL